MTKAKQNWVSLKEFFDENARRYVRSRVGLAPHDQQNPFSLRYSTGTRGSFSRDLREAAALTAIAGRCLDLKLGAVKLPDAKTFRKLFLGGLVNQFSISCRNTAYDRAQAERAIIRHAPALLGQSARFARPAKAPARPF